MKKMALHCKIIVGMLLGVVWAILSIYILTDSLVRYSRSNHNIFALPRRFVFIVLKNSAIIRKFILNVMTNGL